MNYDKGKSRSGGCPKSRKSLGPNEEGVWKNSRFAHTVTSLVGLPVSVETVSDGTYEGILWTISTFLDVVLVQSHLVDKEHPDEIRQETLEDKRTIHAKDIVRVFAMDVDLEYATKKTFQTDHQISGKSNGPMRELEEWKPEEGDCEELEGSLESSNHGWKPEDMFAKNEQNYGIKSTYKENLEGYTTQLSTEGRDSAEYKEREAKATEIARQIEQNTSAIELENGDGDNEEEAFSAVVRTASPHHHNRISQQTYHRSSHRDSSSNEDHNSSMNSTNKYIPPSRRGPKNTPTHSRSHNDRDNDNDYNHHHAHHHQGSSNHHSNNHHHHHSHHHYASGSNYKGGQQDDKSHYQQHRSNNYNHSHRGDGKPPRINKSLSTSSSNNNSNNGNPHHSGPSPASVHSNINNNNNNNPVKNKQESPDSSSKKKESPAPSPDLGVEKTAATTTEETEAVVETKRGPSPENKPRVHFSDQSPSNPSSSNSPSSTTNTPPATTTNSTSSSTSSTKKSVLNPNAKEFVLNPNAKMFTSNLSRPPMSTTPSRPQTPATPAGTPFTTQTFIPGYVPHIPTSTQPTRNRAQREYLRPELTSPIQVAPATASPLVPVSYPHHIPFQTQNPVAGTPPHHPHHHQQHGVVMRMGSVLQHNFALAAAGASSLEPLNLGGASPGQQQNQWTTATVSTSQAPPPPPQQQQQQQNQGTPQVPLTATPPAPSHTPSPGPQVIFPLAMTQHQQQHSQGNNQAPPVNSLAYTHHHHHPSSAATFAASASPGTGHYPPNLLALPHTAVLSGHPPMIHPPMMPSQQGHVHGGGLSLTTYITPPTAVPGHQNHLLHSHIAQ